MSNVRVRFAPSPTGFFHIGSARTALFNWLYARHTGGTFVLRIEDTDKERNTPEALEHLLKGMRWLGLDWDEGPEKGGDYGPYFQSERGDIYQEYLQKLRDAGRAYDKEGAVWLKISGEPQEINDAVRGKVVRTEEKDFVIFRSNGSPVFHFVNVVDDITMGITHVIRGEDHLSNTSKHTELVKAFGETVPQYAHIPLILKSNGPGKMSKRDEGSLIEEYQRRHFLPEAVRNYLCLLGWSPKDDREILPLDEIISLFDLPGINKNNARFDERKLSHINTEYLRQLPIETLCEMAKPILKAANLYENEEDHEEGYLQRVLLIAQEKISSLDTLPDFLGYFFTDDYVEDPKAKEKLFNKGDPKSRLPEVYEMLSSLDNFYESTLEEAIQNLCEQKERKPGEYILAIRFAVTGQGVGPSLYALLDVLGKNRVLARIKRFIEVN